MNIKMNIKNMGTVVVFTALALMVFLTGPAKVNAGCVGASQTFEFGDTVTESCTFDGDMVRPSGVTGHGLIAGADDITIDGNGYCLDGDVKSCVGGETNDAGIESVCHSNVTIKNLEVKNFCHGIEMKGCGPNDVTNNTIECCVVHDNGEPGGDVPGAQTQGIKWNNLSNSLITNCKIYNQLGDPAASGPPGGFGIYLCGGDDNEWCHNEVYDNAKAGLFLRCSPWRAWLHHNYLHDNPFAGIRAQCVNDKDFLVEYNYCVNNNGDDGGYGIFFGGAASDPNCVRYNVCKWNRVGIAFERESWCGHLYENTACENEAWDIYVQDYAVVTGDCNICGNTYNYNDTSATSGCLYACGDEPAAGFTSELTDPLTIAFTDTSVPGNQGDPIDSYYWDFGDCSVPGTSTDQNPTHVYDEPGTYTVCFSVTDDKACPNGCPCDPPPPGAPGVTEGRRDTVCQEVVVQELQEQPDLVISEKSEEWIDSTDQSQGYKVHYTVKNQGTGSANASTTCLTIDGTASGTDQACPALDPGETHSGTFEGPFICSGDSDTIEVCADCDEEVTEGNEGNNCKENEWTCSAVSEPDLVISEKSEEWINPSDPSHGYKVNYTVKNQGGAAAGASNTSLDIDGTNAGGQSCPALDSGAVHLGTFDGPFFCDDANDTVKVCADSGNVVEESDETNNCKENEWICSANLFDIGDGAGKPGDTDKKVEVSLTNAVDVAGIQVDICDAGDYLSLPNVNNVELTDRAAGFICDFEDDYEETGCARLVLYSESGSVIAAGDGPILILYYDVDSGAGAHSCVEINSENLLITDEGDNPLTVVEDPGSFFFGIYGDPWPYDDVSGTVGDGEVNIFDVVRDLQIILETYTPTDCELVAGDVPTGFGVDCQAPDENIIIFDVVEIVAKILGRANCIDNY